MYDTSARLVERCCPRLINLVRTAHWVRAIYRHFSGRDPTREGLETEKKCCGNDRLLTFRSA